MSKIKKDFIFTLPNKRNLSYTEYGVDTGFPVFYLHGITSSRLSAQPADEVAKKMNIRLIAVDRPGIGLSSLFPFQTLVEWTDDLKNLANALHIDTFSVLGHSGGGAYALASAYTMPERLQSVSIVGSAIPFTTYNLKKFLPKHFHYIKSLAKNIPWCFSALMATLRLLFLKRTDSVVDANLKILPEADRNILTNKKLKEMLVISAMEACRQGSQGISQDASLLTSDWGFDIENIKKPVTIWHGTNDLTIPLPAAKYLHHLLPNSELITRKNQGHLFLFSQWEPVLKKCCK